MTKRLPDQSVKVRHILVTSALPYANGSLHAGHILEHTQADIWVRFQRLRGHHCTYVSADDGHGTTTMLRAKELGITPEALLDQTKREHMRDFHRFHIAHDNYHSTHSKENQALSERIYHACLAEGRINKRDVEQLYDPAEKMFLADRFVTGSCPKCKAADQYGDNCEACGASYEATALLEPKSRLSGRPPVLKSSEHLFFDLPAFTDFLKEWVASDAVHPSIRNKLNEWLFGGLNQWDISRDTPYFGFLIPGYQDKYFYVWMDAPIGYIASFQQLAQTRDDLEFEDYWEADKASAAGTEVHHFIGKDIIYFHALFWPAMLKCSGLRTPTKIHTHGFLTINQSKLSKSRGIHFEVDTYLKHFDPEYLRYYFASRLSPGVDDMDMDFQDLAQKVNSDLVGKLINIASRCAKFINHQFDHKLSAELVEPALFQQALDASTEIADCFESADFASAIRKIMRLADAANEYIQQQEPWKLARHPENAKQVQLICTQGLNLFRVLIIYLKPVMPKLVDRAEAFLDVQPLTWASLGEPLLDHTVKPFEPLMQRLDEKVLLKILGTETEGDDHAPNQKGQIDYSQFAEIELKIARIMKAEEVEGADTLLKLEVDLGDEKRQIFSGIKSAYNPTDLVGRLILMVTNLKAKKMRFGVSQGMLLAAGSGEEIFLLSPDSGAKQGMVVK